MISRLSASSLTPASLCIGNLKGVYESPRMKVVVNDVMGDYA